MRLSKKSEKANKLAFQISIERSAQKSLTKISKADQDKIIRSIQSLSDNPRPHGCKKLSSREAWRIRIGNYRVIYEIDDRHSKILIVVIRHRRDVYR